MVLKQVHDTNMRAKGHPERVFSVGALLPPPPPPGDPPTTGSLCICGEGPSLPLSRLGGLWMTFKLGRLRTLTCPLPRSIGR